MTIGVPSSYGLIALRGSRVESILRAEFRPSAEQVEAHTDEHLFGLAVAQSGQDVQSVVDMLDKHGLLPGRDFAVTSSADGVLAKSAPRWLRDLGNMQFEFKD